MQQVKRVPRYEQRVKDMNEGQLASFAGVLVAVMAAISVREAQRQAHCDAVAATLLEDTAVTL